ncbi:MAG: 1-phosphofructokinase family hexose kinase [Roseinatronobacter sp.]
MRRQTPILTVTLNPALDLSARVHAMVAGPKLRMTDPVLEPGGGGVNVARAVQALGGRATAWVALGGAVGAQHLALMQAQGLDVEMFELAGTTRESWAIMDATGQQFRLQLPGPEWSAQDCAQAIDAICDNALGLVVLSGSLPPGSGARFVQDLAASLPSQTRLIIDTSGPALAQIIRHPDPQARPHLLRLDQAEAEERALHPLLTIAATLDFARGMVARGVAEYVCVAKGAEGSVLAGYDGTALHCRPPRVPVRSKVGAGDSFVGGFVLALARGQEMAGALKQGTAAAAAAVMTEGTELCRAEDVAAIGPDCQMHDLTQAP